MYRIVVCHAKGHRHIFISASSAVEKEQVDCREWQYLKPLQQESPPKTVFTYLNSSRVAVIIFLPVANLDRISIPQPPPPLKESS